MTTIAVRHGIIAADSRVTVDTEAGGTRVFRCQKLYEVRQHGRKRAIVALAGGAFDGIEFLEWIKGPGREPPQRLIDGNAEFTALVMNHDGLFEYDRWCRPERVIEPFYAVGSGAKAALGALHAGKSALDAVRIACKIDPFSGPPFVTMTLARTVQPRPSAAAPARRKPRR